MFYHYIDDEETIIKDRKQKNLSTYIEEIHKLKEINEQHENYINTSIFKFNERLLMLSET